MSKHTRNIVKKWKVERKAKKLVNERLEMLINKELLK